MSLFLGSPRRTPPGIAPPLSGAQDPLLADTLPAPSPQIPQREIALVRHRVAARTFRAGRIGLRIYLIRPRNAHSRSAGTFITRRRRLPRRSRSPSCDRQPTSTPCGSAEPLSQLGFAPNNRPHEHFPKRARARRNAKGKPPPAVIDPISSAPLMTMTGTTSRGLHDTVRPDFMISDGIVAALPRLSRGVGGLFRLYRLTKANKRYRSTGLSLRGGNRWRRSNENVTPRRHAMRVTHEGDNHSTHQFGRLRQCALEDCGKRCYRLSVTGDNGRGSLAPALNSPNPALDWLKMGSDPELHPTRIVIAVARNGNATAGNP